MADYSATILKLVEYEIWCNLRALEFVEGLSEEACKRDFGFGLRTPHRTVFHIAEVVRGWSRSVGPVIREPEWLTYDSTLDLHQIRLMLTDASAYWLTATRDSHVKGVLAEEGRLNHVFHLITHGTHHRGQLLSMITLMGGQQPFEGGDFGGWIASI